MGDATARYRVARATMIEPPRDGEHMHGLMPRACPQARKEGRKGGQQEEKSPLCDAVKGAQFWGFPDFRGERELRLWGAPRVLCCIGT
jgi:hypothetical protein